MYMFQKILVPVDGSDTAWKALKTAAALASKFQGEIRVFTVMEPYNSLSLFQITLDQNLMDHGNREMKKASLAVLNTAKENSRNMASMARFPMKTVKEIRRN